MTTKHFSDSFVYGYHDQNVRTLLPFVEHLVGRPCRALEIGAYEGKFSCWWMDNVGTHEDREVRLVCLDNWSGYDTTIDMAPGTSTNDAERIFDANVRGYGMSVWKVKADSFDYLTAVKPNRKVFDFVLVDGEHEALDALTDLVLSWRLLRPGGVLAFDDYGWTVEAQPTRVRTPPKVAWDGFEATRPEGLVVLHRGWQVIAKKEG